MGRSSGRRLGRNFGHTGPSYPGILLKAPLAEVATARYCRLQIYRSISKEGPANMSDVGGIARDRLRTIVERIERLEEEKTALSADIREVYSEAKGTGFDAKILRQIVRLRKLDGADRREQEELLDLYKLALEME
jgi:uncharacterized protein (UPF0335 family)